MIIWRDWPLANDHPSPQSPLPGSRFKLAKGDKQIPKCTRGGGADLGLKKTIFGALSLFGTIFADDYLEKIEVV